MNTTEKKQLDVMLATDCGSTTTKAILVVKTSEGYRLAGRGEAPTTVEAPFDDVTVGVRNAVEELEDITGRRLLDDDGNLISPPVNGDGIDAYFSTSSAGGGLQMACTGVISSISGASAERAALGAGAIVIDTVALDDPRENHERIEHLRHIRPDMILMAGGTNGGTRRHVEMIAEIIRAAQPQPRFGGGFKLPVIYSGNTEARELADELLGPIASVRHVDNVRPDLDREDVFEARHAIHELFLEHVMQQAPGYPKLMAITSADIMPTPTAVGIIIQIVAEERKQNVLAVDIGGATTDIFSVFRSQFHRTVSANYGMSYSLCNVMAETGVPNILRWLPFKFDPSILRDILRNKMIRPTTIPETKEELYIEQAAAREALRLSLIHHKALAVDLRGMSRDVDIGAAFDNVETTLVTMMNLDLCIGSGGVLSHAPDRSQAALMMLDAFQLEGVTQLAVDSIFMMPQLGVMTQLQPEAAKEVFDHDCMIVLGTAIAPVGQTAPGKKVMDVSITFSGERTEQFSIVCGEMKRIALPSGETAQISVQPTRHFDAGNGPGKTVETEVTGGITGIVLDGRGRPLVFDPDQEKNAAQRRRDYEAMLLPLEGV